VTAFRSLFAALVLAQVAYGQLPGRRSWAATRGVVGLMLATSLAESVVARGPRRGPRAVLAAGALGFCSELVGVATGRPFGHYSYGPGLGPQVGRVPLLAAAAWAMMARPAWVVGGWLARTPVVRVLVAAGALTAWDVFLDPRMVREDYWTWPGGGWYEDVPLSNFAGWYVTGAAVFSAWTLVERGDAAADARDDGALALYLWTFAGEAFANAVLWRRPRVAVVGGAAMGLFALPALRARLRAGSSSSGPASAAWPSRCAARRPGTT
jgi:putative membrane protein